MDLISCGDNENPLMAFTIVEIIGWVGASAFVLAYLLLSLGILTSEKLSYHALNAFGGILMSISTFYMRDRPAFFVNVIWMGIAIYSIFRIVLVTRRTR